MSDQPLGAAGTPETTDVRSALVALWKEHRGTIRERINSIDKAIVSLMQNELTKELREAAARDAHKLSGSLGTFGYSDGTRLARELERQFEGDAPLSPTDSVQLSELAVALRRELDREPTFQVDVRSITEATAEDGLPLLIISLDKDWAQRLTMAAAGVGFAPTVATTADWLPMEEAPTAVILDLDGVEPARYEAVVNSVDSAPTLVLAGSDEAMGEPIAVSHREGRVFVRKSVGPDGIVRVAADLTSRRRSLNITVLVVDDDPAILDAVRTLLERRGIRVETLQHPAEYAKTLENVEPDLVVLDIDMPETSGIELCRRTRADPTWSATPILFLTASGDHALIEQVFSAGADDYIRKPLVGPEFLTRVMNRLERVHLLRSFAERDPLTGLLNRSAVSPVIGNQLSLAEKERVPVAVALIDIDSLTRVNEWHGHAAGDRVLRRTGRLLGTEFESEVALARWSGVTFAASVFGCSADDLAARLSRIVAQLWDQTFAGQSGEAFRASFSAGVAAYPGDGHSLNPLIRAADRALQVAKSQGTGVIRTTTSDPSGQLATDRVEVLIVEDDEPVAALLQHALKTRGHSVMWIADGKEALDALIGTPPKVTANVLLLDVGLPGLDGLSILRNLSREGMLKRTRVIMLTSRSEESEVLKALELGAFDHVAKPFSLPILMHRVRRALEI
jgi:diguanylate cyclase (GGDEF)-like protein